MKGLETILARRLLSDLEVRGLEVSSAWPEDWQGEQSLVVSVP